MNEGFATFTHYHVMHRLHEEKLISDAAFERFIRLHTNVIFQPDFDKPYYNGINPYGISFAMFQDVVRMCKEPTDEDRKWFPDIAGRDWRPVIKDMVEMCRDDSFFLHHLSPTVIRDFRLFSYIGDSSHDHLLVSAIHRDDGYKEVRRVISEQYEPSRLLPILEVTGVDVLGDRTLNIRHRQLRGRTLHEEDTVKTMVYAEKLWEFPIELTGVNSRDETTLRMRVMNGSASYYVKYQE
jgi:spore cortex formation protein SpoVR/YcgB (stage V sporulation)